MISPVLSFKSSQLNGGWVWRQRDRSRLIGSIKQPIFSLANSIGVLGGLNLLCFEHERSACDYRRVSLKASRMVSATGLTGDSERCGGSTVSSLICGEV